MNQDISHTGCETPAADDDSDSCCCISSRHPHFQSTAAAKLKQQLEEVIAWLDLSAADVSLVVVDDEMMAELHEQYMNLPGTTDVLTFDLMDVEHALPAAGRAGVQGRAIEGEIYICYDEAARQAANHRHATEREVLLYGVHGLLHLLGHDDQDAENFEKMHSLEDECLEAIGVGAVFAKGLG